MNEYIKRENVMQTLQKANIGGYITERLLEIPSEDVQLVKRGRWIDIYEWAKMHDSMPSGMCTYFWCSECQKEQEKKSNFCPNCGARMDLKDSDNNENKNI